MDLECDFSKPEDVVGAFITAMAQWEYEASQAREAASASAEPTSYWPLIQASAQQTFDAYCTPKDRPYGRAGTFTVRDNGNVTVHIVEVDYESPRRCAVTVEQSYLHRYKKKDQLIAKKFRYIVLKKGGKWLVDSRKLYSDMGQWIKYFL